MRRSACSPSMPMPSPGKWYDAKQQNTWSYNVAAGQVATDWNLNLVAIDPNNPPANLTTIQGWLPIEYANGATPPTLATNAPRKPYTYPSLNGNIDSPSDQALLLVRRLSESIRVGAAADHRSPTVAYDPNNPGTTMVSTDYSPQQMLTYIQTYIAQNTNAAASAAAGIPSSTTAPIPTGRQAFAGVRRVRADGQADRRYHGLQHFLTNLASIMTNWFTYTLRVTPAITSPIIQRARINWIQSFIWFGKLHRQHVPLRLFYGRGGSVVHARSRVGGTVWVDGQDGRHAVRQLAASGDTPDLTDPNATSLPFLRTSSLGSATAMPWYQLNGGNNEESSSEAIQSWWESSCWDRR